MSVISECLDILYPRRCPLCDSLIGRKQKFVCKECEKKIRFIDPEIWKKTLRPEKSYFGSDHFYDDFIAAFDYKGRMRESVLRFKYSGRAEYASFFGAALMAYAKNRIKKWDADLILAVPSDASRERDRGYNQARLLAKEISRLSGIPEGKKILKRSRHTRPQSGLDHRERKRNITGAFVCISKTQLPARIILVDDIATTGSTLDEAAKCLKEAGAKKVFALCLCAD